MKAFFAAWRRFQDAVVRHPFCRFMILPAGILLVIWLTALSFLMMSWCWCGCEAWSVTEIFEELAGILSLFIMMAVGSAGGLLTGRWMSTLAGLITTVFALDTYVWINGHGSHSYETFLCYWGEVDMKKLWLLLAAFGLAWLWLLAVDWRKRREWPALSRRLKILAGVAAGILGLAGLLLMMLKEDSIKTMWLLSLSATIWFTVFFGLAWRLMETKSGRIFYGLFAVGTIVFCILMNPLLDQKAVLPIACGLAIISCLPWNAWIQRLTQEAGQEEFKFENLLPFDQEKELAQQKRLALAVALGFVVLMTMTFCLGSLKAIKTQRLFAVCGKGTPEQVQAATGFWTSVNARNKNGQTPLQLAAWLNQNPEVISILLRAGAKVNAQDDNHETLLSSACHNKNPEIMATLIEAGADINAKYYYDRRTLLMLLMTGNENPQTVIMLIKKGADVNAKDKNGLTPLMWALYYDWAIKHKGHLETIKVLIQAGADVNAKDNDGKSVLDYARQCKNQVVINLLTQAGAK